MARLVKIDPLNFVDSPEIRLGTVMFTHIVLSCDEQRGDTYSVKPADDRPFLDAFPVSDNHQ